MDMKKVNRFSILLISVVVCTSLCLSQAPTWQQTNGPYGGDLRSMAVSPKGFVYAGTWSLNGPEEGRLSISSDSGYTWTNLNVPWGQIQTLFVTKQGTLLLNADSSLFRSDDDGLTWRRVVHGIVSDTLVGFDLTLISEANHDMYAGVYGKGLFRSSDYGDSWTLVDTSDTARSFRMIVSDTQGLLFAGGLGVAKSTDSGRTWIQTNIGLEQTNRIVQTLTMNGDGTLYVTINAGGLFKSTDSGNTWSSLNSELSFAFDFVISPTGDYFCASGGIIFRSTDQGTTWNWTIKGICGYVEYLGVDSSGILYGGTDRGTIYRSLDNGETWSTSGLPDKYIRSIVLDSSDTVYAGMNQYVSRSTDGGNHWQTRTKGLPQHFALYDLAVTRSNFIFACTDSGLYQSRLDSLSWTPNSRFSGIVVRSIAISNNNVLFVGAGNGIYKSSDNGNSWETLSTPSIWIKSIAFNAQGEIFAGGVSGLLKSTDYGITWNWVNLDSMLHGGVVQTLAIAPNGTIYAGGWGGVLRSKDDGITWGQILGEPNSGLGVGALAVTPNGDVYTTWDSVLRSTDNGDSWLDVNEGLGRGGGAPTCFAFSTDGLIYAGSWYGAFRTNSTITSARPPEQNSMPTTFFLYQNYPNPFNPTTAIRYQLPVTGIVMLKVYNVLGQVVQTLVDGVQNAGYKSNEWNAGAIASGMYIYRLEVTSIADPSKSFSQVKKMILMK